MELDDMKHFIFWLAQGNESRFREGQKIIIFVLSLAFFGSLIFRYAVWYGRQTDTRRR